MNKSGLFHAACFMLFPVRVTNRVITPLPHHEANKHVSRLAECWVLCDVGLKLEVGE
jgi:hypothetical protein